VKRTSRLLAIVMLSAMALVGCDSTAPSTPPVSTATPSAAPSAGLSPDTTAASPSPTPGLINVQTEADRAQSSEIDQKGGIVTATGGNGAVYALSVPPGAVSQTTLISLAPVTRVSTLPAGAALVAAVQFSPDGLQLRVPATLTIQLSSPPDPALTGIVWHGDGADVRREPIIVDGQAVTLEVDHFSAGGAWVPKPDWLAALACAEDDYECQTAKALDLMSTFPHTRENLRFFLRNWYRDTVSPYFRDGLDAVQSESGAEKPNTIDLDDDESELLEVYGGWLHGIDVARGWLRDPSFTVAAEVADSRTWATAILRGLATGYNAACAASQADEVAAIYSADQGIRLHHDAERFHVSSHASGLDVATLRAQSCVQLSLNPNPAYTGTEPGQDGTLEVTAGFTINGGPVRFDQPVHIEVRPTSSNITFVGQTSAGHCSITIPWPNGVNPIRLPIEAGLEYDDPAAAALGGRLRHQTEITWASSVTTSAEDLFRSTFDIGFDGWDHGTIDRVGTTTYGEVNHSSLGGGVIHLDGRGGTAFPKAWIVKSFALPSNAKYLRFDVSAEIIAGSSSIVEVRVVGADGSDTVLLPPTTVRNFTNHLSFVHERLDLSRWAGQEVMIYIEQAYNRAGNFDKEIYVDNVRITAV
jgi:hypothetical protein